MSRTRLLVLGAIVLLALSGMAQAQVAAPVLTPGSADITAGNPGFVVDPTFVPTNPSVMSWNGKSVFGLGQARTERDPVGAGKTTEYGSSYAGLRWTGEKLAIGVETTKMETNTSGTTFSLSNASAGVSGKVAEWLSVGVALGTAKIDSGTSTDSFSALTVGGSIKLGEIFYIGLGMGRDSDDHKQTGNTYKDDRSTSQYGIGLYTGGKGGSERAVWHLEYSVQEADDFQDANGGKTNGYSRATGTVEVIWKTILLSYSTYSIEAKSGTGGVKGTLDGSAAELGWVLDKGLYISARVQKSSEGPSSNTNRNEVNTQAINIGLQF